MFRLFQFSLLSGGICLLVMTAAVGVVRQDELLQWMIYEDEGNIFRLHPESGYQQLILHSHSRYPSYQWTFFDNYLYFVMWTESSRLPHLYRINPNGQQLVQLSRDVLQGINQFWISDSDTIIVQTTEDHFKPSELFILKLNDTSLEWRNLTNSPTISDYFWAMSPDNDWVYFASRMPDGTGYWSVNRLHVENGQLEVLSQAPTEDAFIGWSPDREWLWLSFENGPRQGIFRLSFDGGQLEHLTRIPLIQDVGWSSDNNWFVFTARSQNGHPEIFRIDRDGQNLTNLSVDYDYQGATPRFDAQRTAILVAFCQQPRCGQDIFRIDIDTGAATQLTQIEGDEQFLLSSEDGSQMIYVETAQDSNGLQRRYLLAGDNGQHPIPLTEWGDFSAIHGWSADQKWILFESATENESRNLFRIRTDGTARQQLTHSLGDVTFHTWSPPITPRWNMFQSLILAITLVFSSLLIVPIRRRLKLVI